MVRMAVRGVASLLLLAGLCAGPALALDIGPRTVPVKIFGLVLPIPLTASLDMHTDADHVALALTATLMLAPDGLSGRLASLLRLTRTRSTTALPAPSMTKGA